MSERRCTSDLSDNGWEIVESQFPPAPPAGHPQIYSYREILNARFYVLRTGCQWRNLHKGLPPWSAVYIYYCNWTLNGFWRELHDRLRPNGIRGGQPKRQRE